MQASARATLSNLVEEHLTSLVRDASTARRHAKRARFAPRSFPADADVPNRGRGGDGGDGDRARDGGDEHSAALRPLLHSDDVNLALAWRGSERIYSTQAGGIAAPVPPALPGGGGQDGTATTAPPSSTSAGLPSSSSSNPAPGPDPASSSALAESVPASLVSHPNPSASSGDDSSRPVDLNAYLRSENRVRPPSELGAVGHWLAVDGVQPDIPQNPPPVRAGHEEGDVPGAVDGGRAGGGVAGVVGGGGAGEPHRIEDDEDDYEDDLRPRKRGRQNDDSAGKDGAKDADAVAGAGGGGGGTPGVSVRHLLPRLLSEELRLYFTRITLAVERGLPAQVDAALVSVGRDSGIQELVPFFMRFVAKSVYDNLGRADYCRTLVRLAARLVGNPHVHLELHLHQMLPAIITCIVARRLSLPPSAGGDGGDHWSLREEASRTLVLSCRKFGDRYPTLRARSLRALCEALVPDRPLTTRYGGIVGLSMFGPRAVDAFILPVATTYWDGWDEALRREEGRDAAGRGGGDGGARAFEIRQCQMALLNALGVFMANVTIQEQAERLDSDSLAEAFGEKLIPLQSDGASEPYTSCIL